MADSAYSPKNFFDEKNRLLCGLEHQDFYSHDEFHDIRNVFETANVEKMQKYMQKLMNNTIVAEYIASNDVGENITIEIFQRRFFHVFLQEILHRYRYINDILKLILNEYNFVPDDYFVETFLYYILFIDDLFIIFHHIVSTKKYIKRLTCLFNTYIDQLKMKQIQRFIDLGYDINELCKISDESENKNILEKCIFNPDINVFIFLLDIGVDFHKYETSLLQSCVESYKNDHLRVLIDRGANIKLLRDIKIENKECLNTYKTLLEHDIDIDNIIYLLSRK